MARALTLTPASATPGAAITVKGTGCLAGETGSVLAPDGVVVCAGIHMTDIPGFPYADLWQERVIRSVANLSLIHI